MKYRLDKKGNKISILSYGCMRFTKTKGKIDLEKAEKEIMEAISGGVNYFDTAYIYGGSEMALGSILKRNNCREDIYIATKLPHYMIKSRSSIDKHFDEQLARLQTDYIDYYLVHMLTDVRTWSKLTDLGIVDWLKEKMQSRQIRNIGFSYHGNTDMFIQLLDTYDWDFCQIQYNYMDEYSQAGRKGLRYATKKGVPVIIMEPLRGGKLVDMLPAAAKDLFAGAKSKRTPAEWAFRWLWDQPEVTTVLSGMNSLEMIKENIKVANEAEPGQLTTEDYRLFEQVKDEINRKMKVGCTGCGYCMPCPMEVDIPGTFRCYNVKYMENVRTAVKEYIMCTAFRENSSSASSCVKCGKCVSHCPQNIDIPVILEQAKRELETPVYKIVRKIVQIFHIW